MHINRIDSQFSPESLRESLGLSPTLPSPAPQRGPTRASIFPESAAGRKERPVATGVLDYFPDSLVAVAQVSWAGNNQHNPGEPLHWAREKSSDEADALLRHFLQRGGIDSDGLRHSAKMAWRALALLQKELEAEWTPTPAELAALGRAEKGR